MDTFDTLVQRNRDFATTRFVAGLPIRPSLQTIIIGCADPRVDPANLLGLEPGEAAVLRNVGGRIVPGTLRLLRMLTQIPGANTRASGAPFNLVVLQHTDCGIKQLASDTAMMADYFGVPAAELPAKSLLDPQAAVVSDVATLRTIPGLPPAILVSGLVYDVATGLVNVVVPPAPLRQSAS